MGSLMLLLPRMVSSTDIFQRIGVTTTRMLLGLLYRSTTQLEKQDVYGKTADSFPTGVATQYGGKIVASQQVTLNIVNGNSAHGNKGRFPFGAKRS